MAREILNLNNNYNSRNALSVRLFDADPSVCTDSFISIKKTEEVLEGAAIVGKAMVAEKIFVLYDKSIKMPAKPPFENMVFINVPESKQLMCGKREIDIIIENNKYEYKTTIAIDSSTAFASYEAVVLPMLDNHIAVNQQVPSQSAFYLYQPLTLLSRVNTVVIVGVGAVIVVT